jgi:hypothetical protein
MQNKDGSGLMLGVLPGNKTLEEAVDQAELHAIEYAKKFNEPLIPTKKKLNEYPFRKERNHGL